MWIKFSCLVILLRWIWSFNFIYRVSIYILTIIYILKWYFNVFFITNSVIKDNYELQSIICVISKLEITFFYIVDVLFKLVSNYYTMALLELKITYKFEVFDIICIKNVSSQRADILYFFLWLFFLFICIYISSQLTKLIMIVFF